MDPINAVSQKFRYEKNFDNFLIIFSNLICENKKNILREQWNELSNYDFANHFDVTEVKPEYFWNFVLTLQVQENVQAFKDIGSVALTALGIPHANAKPERVFSDLKNTKTDKRNSLNVETVEAILQARELITSLGGDKNFEPPSEMIDMYLERKYNKKKKTTNNISLGYSHI